MKNGMVSGSYDFNNMSVEELNNLITAAVNERNTRIEREKRAREAEEYEIRIYDLIEQILGDNFTIRVNDELVTDAYDISVEP